MTAISLIPRVRLMALCDRVRESKTEASVFHLKGVRQALTTPVFPFRPSRLWLFVVFSSPRAGEFPCYVRVVNDRTDKIVFYSHMEPRPAFGPDGGISINSAPIKCFFQEAGRYSVQVLFFQEQGSDILKGELPFVVAEGA